jgi:hypothetical protein
MHDYYGTGNRCSKLPAIEFLFVSCFVKMPRYWYTVLTKLALTLCMMAYLSSKGTITPLRGFQHAFELTRNAGFS